MKNCFLLIALVSGITYSAFSQTTATDFTANDCAGTSHHLFAELDSGKIIVVSFVMPCHTCIGPSLGAQSVVQSYATSHPGRVRFYLADDYANTTCASLNSWAAANSMSGVTTFSTTAFKESDYGAMGMPKVIVLAGTNHHIYFNQDNTLNTTDLQNAVNTAIAAVSVPQSKSEIASVSVFPNPAKDKISVNYSLTQPGDVTIDIYNIIGAKVLSVNRQDQSTGNHIDYTVNFGGKIGGGIYFLRLTTGTSSQSFKFIVDK